MVDSKIGVVAWKIRERGWEAGKACSLLKDFTNADIRNRVGVYYFINGSIGSSMSVVDRLPIRNGIGEVVGYNLVEFPYFYKAPETGKMAVVMTSCMVEDLDGNVVVLEYGPAQISDPKKFCSRPISVGKRVGMMFFKDGEQFQKILKTAAGNDPGTRIHETYVFECKYFEGRFGMLVRNRSGSWDEVFVPGSFNSAFFN